MKIKGNGIDQMVRNGKSFFYSLHSCDVINEIRRNKSVPEVTCKDTETRDKVLNQFYVANKVMYTFFDPNSQIKNANLETASQFTNTTIISTIG